MIEQDFDCTICLSHSHKRLFTKLNFEIVKCMNCGIVCTVIPKNFDLNSIYDSSYFEGGQADGYGNYVATADEDSGKADFCSPASNNRFPALM